MDKNKNTASEMEAKKPVRRSASKEIYAMANTAELERTLIKANLPPRKTEPAEAPASAPKATVRKAPRPQTPAVKAQTPAQPKAPAVQEKTKAAFFLKADFV